MLQVCLVLYMLFSGISESKSGELNFHELATPSLAVDVSHISPMPYTHLPHLKLPLASHHLQHYRTRDAIDSACFSIQSLLPDDDSCIILGFSIKFKDEPLSIETMQFTHKNVTYVFEVRWLLEK